MTEHPNKSSPHQYSLFHFITLSPKGGILVYMNLYLKRAGLNDSQLGTIAAIFSFMSIISSPIWGIIADSVKDMRRIIVMLFYLLVWSIHHCFLQETITLSAVSSCFFPSWKHLLPHSMMH